MLTYNTQKKKLILPEYGRNIQSMVDYCLTIEDREERTRCAYTIVTSMKALFPQMSKSEENRQKLWDHLAIMSDFKLDIDYPVEIVSPENLESKPRPVARCTNKFRYRHYGNTLEKMIDHASAMEEGPERDELVLLIANHMKKAMLAVNSDGVDDAKIFHDLAELSHGAIRLSPETTKLHEFQAAPTAPTGKKKRKK